MQTDEIVFSPLPKTWILDVDGTLVKHNGHITDGKDSLLKGVVELFSIIAPEDLIIIVTSRDEKYRSQLEQLFNCNSLRYDYMIFGAPCGERIIVNDKKPSGLQTALAINVTRDEGVLNKFIVDPTM